MVGNPGWDRKGGWLSGSLPGWQAWVEHCVRLCLWLCRVCPPGWVMCVTHLVCLFACLVPLGPSLSLPGLWWESQERGWGWGGDTYRASRVALYSVPCSSPGPATCPSSQLCPALLPVWHCAGGTWTCCSGATRWAPLLSSLHLVAEKGNSEAPDKVPCEGTHGRAIHHCQSLLPWRKEG